MLAEEEWKEQRKKRQQIYFVSDAGCILQVFAYCIIVNSGLCLEGKKKPAAGNVEGFSFLFFVVKRAESQKISAKDHPED